jgi:O-antigen ligase
VVPAVGAISSWARGEHLVEGDRAAWVGQFGNPNDLAHHLVVGVALALGAREAARSRWLRLAYLPSLATMAVALLLTQSRGGILSAGAVVALWTLRGARVWRGRGSLAVGVAAALGLAVELAPETTWRRAETTLDYQEDASAQGRIDAWRTGLNVLAERPLSGVGAGAFALAWPEFAPGDAGPPRSAHNTFVQIVGELGLPALVLFAGALVAAAAGLGGAGDDPICASVRVALVGFASCSLTGGYAFSWPLYLLLGLAAALARIRAREEAAT